VIDFQQRAAQVAARPEAYAAACEPQASTTVDALLDQATQLLTGNVSAYLNDTTYPWPVVASVPPPPAGSTTVPVPAVAAPSSSCYP
jgi:hypothetical protein